MHTLLCKCVEINQKIKKNHKCNLCPKNNDSIILSHVSYAKELIFFMLKFTQLFNVPFDPKIKQIDSLLQILWIKESRETISLAFFFVALACSSKFGHLDFKAGHAKFSSFDLKNSTWHFNFINCHDLFHVKASLVLVLKFGGPHAKTRIEKCK